MVATDDSPEWGFHEGVLSTVSRRFELLTTLATRPHERPELVDRLESSRATVYRAIRRFEETGLVERTEAGYRLTTWGRVVLEAYREFVDLIETVREARTLLNALPGEPQVPHAIFHDATVLSASGPDPHAPASRLGSLILDADRIRGLAKAHTQSNAVDVWHRSVFEGGTPTELVLDAEFYDYLHGSTHRKIEALAGSDAFETRRVSSVPFGLFILEAVDGEDHAVLVAYDSEDLLVGIVDSTDPRAIRAAESVFESYRPQ